MATTEQAGLQTFNTAYPFDFTIRNQYRGKDLPVLYIVDNHASKKIQEVKVSITTQEDQQLVLKNFTIDYPKDVKSFDSIPCLAPANIDFVPNGKEYNLALVFRNGIINKELLPNLSNNIQKALDTALSSNPDSASNKSIVYGPL
ncbi:MAG: hypothetical protein ABJE29_03885, partial [Balneola sp.]